MEKPAGISSEAVKAKTGRGWDEWFLILDKAGASKMEHREIVALIHTTHGVGSWWRQMITVGYEQARGKRQVHQQSDGFTANVSRTIDSPVGDVFVSWIDARRRRKWLGEAGLTVRSTKENKSVRISWADGTSVEVIFQPKGPLRSSIAVEHSKLKAAKDVASRKAFWAEALDRLKQIHARRPTA